MVRSGRRAGPPHLSPRPRRHRLRISPQPFPRLSCFLLQPFKYRISCRVLPVPPAPAFFDECVIDVGAIGQEHIGDRAPVLVLAEGVERHLFTEHELRRRLLGSRAVGLAFLGTVNAVESDTFNAGVVQHFDGVAVENGDDGTGELRGGDCNG